VNYPWSARLKAIIGVSINAVYNGISYDISAHDSKVKIFVLPTDEENGFMIFYGQLP